MSKKKNKRTEFREPIYRDVPCIGCLGVGMILGIRPCVSCGGLGYQQVLVGERITSSIEESEDQ